VALDIDGAVDRRELDGIGEKVDEDLSDLISIRLGNEVVVAVSEVETQVFGAKLRPDERFEISDDGARRHLFGGIVHLPCLEPRVIQDVVDEREQCALASADTLEV